MVPFSCGHLYPLLVVGHNDSVSLLSYEVFIAAEGELATDSNRFEAALFVVRKKAANLASQVPGLGKRKHAPPYSSEELFFAEKKGGHRGKISVVFFKGFLYRPSVWKVFL